MRVSNNFGALNGLPRSTTECSGLLWSGMACSDLLWSALASRCPVQCEVDPLGQIAPATETVIMAALVALKCDVQCERETGGEAGGEREGKRAVERAKTGVLWVTFCDE